MAEPCVAATMAHEPVASTTEGTKDDSDGRLPTLLNDTKTTGNDKRLSEKLKQDEKDQTWSAIENKVENEGRKTVGRRLWMPWIGQTRIS